MAYSEDLRMKTIEYLEQGHTLASASKVFNIDITTIHKWKKQYQELGHVRKKQLNRSFKKIDPAVLTDYVKKHPDAYLKEIAQVFGCTDEAVRLALRHLGITRKKRQRYTGNAMKKEDRNF